MAQFWGEIQLVQTQIKHLKGQLMIWRTKMQVKVQGTVELKDSICFK